MSNFWRALAVKGLAGDYQAGDRPPGSPQHDQGRVRPHTGSRFEPLARLPASGELPVVSPADEWPAAAPHELLQRMPPRLPAAHQAPEIGGDAPAESQASRTTPLIRPNTIMADMTPAIPGRPASREQPPTTAGLPALDGPPKAQMTPTPAGGRMGRPRPMGEQRPAVSLTAAGEGPAAAPGQTAEAEPAISEGQPPASIWPAPLQEAEKVVEKTEVITPIEPFLSDRIEPQVERLSGRAEAPTVRVHIGRIEVRAVQPQTVQSPARSEPRPRYQPPISLDDYLRKRSGGQA